MVRDTAAAANAALSNCDCGPMRETKLLSFLETTVLKRHAEVPKAALNHPRGGPEYHGGFEVDPGRGAGGYWTQRFGRRLSFIY